MKRISTPKADIDKLVAEFKTQLETMKTNETKIVFERSFEHLTKIDEKNIKKPFILFSQEAWIKMHSLVKECSDEIAWQAIVKRSEEKDYILYYVDKTYVYPQKVTGTFVDTDPVAYTEWSMKLPDDVYNNLRFQGHSHVNMATAPSGTDMNTYQGFLDQLDDNDYYIFMILNKRGEFDIFVYDYKQDIIFETKDCTVDVLLPQTTQLSKWLTENMKLVEKKPVAYTTPYYSSEWPYNYYNQGYYGVKDKDEDEDKDVITAANNSYYTKNGKRHYFGSQIEAAKFFAEHQEFITEYVPNKQILAIMKHLEAPKTQRGRKTKNKEK